MIIYSEDGYSTEEEISEVIMMIMIMMITKMKVIQINNLLKMIVRK